jgi:hypothetical protein
MEHHTCKNKIEELSTLLHMHIDKEDGQIEALTVAIKNLAQTIQPLVDIYHSSSGFFKTTTYVLKAMALLGAGIAALLYLLKIGK